MEHQTKKPTDDRTVRALWHGLCKGQYITSNFLRPSNYSQRPADARQRIDEHQARVANVKSRHASLTTIQASRAVAALLVVLYHLSYIFPLFGYVNHDPAHGVFQFGHSGVQFFFVLSGFIIFYIHRKDIGSRDRFWGYLQKRFIRIYPIYWVVLAAIIPVLVLVPSFGHAVQRQWSVVVSSITLLRFDALIPSTWHSASEIDQAIVPVSWTLFHEVLFYLMFAIAIKNRRIGILALGSWYTASLIMLFFAGVAYPITFLFSPLHLLFAMGVAACWFVQNRKVRVPALWATVGVLLFFVVGATDKTILNNQTWTTYNSYSLLYGISGSMAIAGLVTLEQQGRIAVGRLPRLLGDASYSIYLIHFTLFSALVKVFVRLGLQRAVNPTVLYATLVVTACFVGTMLHIVVEKPLLKSLRARVLLSPSHQVRIMAHALTSGEIGNGDSTDHHGRR